jgi:thiol-disulfide isomerase/thioredoxin
VLFATAGLAKIFDRSGAKKTIVEFGFPAILAGFLGIFIPILELTTAALLVPIWSAWWGALSGLVLLLLFAAAIVINLAYGRTPDCRCFGKLRSERIGWRTLARNLVLAAAAGFVVWQGTESAGPSAVGWLADVTLWQTAGFVVGAIITAVMAAQSWFLLQLFRQHGRLLLRLDTLERMLGGNLPALDEWMGRAGLPVGVPAPAFELLDLDGTRVAFDELRAAGRPMLLVFMAPGCGSCDALVPSLGHWQDRHGEALTLVLVSSGTPDENRAKVANHDGLRVLLQAHREVAEVYQAHGTPAAVVIRSDGTIGSSVAMGAAAIERLVESTAAMLTSEGGEAEQAIAQLGSPAPAFSLLDLTGHDVTLEKFRRQLVLVLFWNPGCGHCGRMLPDLKRWETAVAEGAPKLLVVSSGTVEANRAMGLRATVVLDQTFSTAQAFGAGGTPSAVLVDMEGRIASAVAVGATQVFKLLEVGPSALVAWTEPI